MLSDPLLMVHKPIQTDGGRRTRVCRRASASNSGAAAWTKPPVPGRI